MKLCWDNLNHIVLMPGLASSTENRLVYYENPEELLRGKGQYDLSEWPCDECGNYFLQKHNQTNKFCDKECRTTYFTNRKIKREKAEKLERSLRKKNLVKKSSWNKGLKYGVIKKKAGYEVYKEKLEWFTEIRPDPETGMILQVKCCICGEWFSPAKGRVIDIVAHVYEGKGSTWGFYCSIECSNECPSFQIRVKEIMKNDYLNNGKAKYSELHSIPDRVLYYDWQEKLRIINNKKLLRIKTNKEKVRTKRKISKHLFDKLKRQKKREAKRKEKENNTLSYRKKVRLKRMVYLTKHRAKKKGWDHNIDYEWVVENTGDTCPKSGIKYDYNLDIKMNSYAPSIDRIDRNKGYTKDNCIITSWFYNCAKNAFDDDTLYKICKAYLNFSGECV